jgi:hypothetical protein
MSRRIVCGRLPEREIVQFLAYAKELIAGIESGETDGAGLTPIVATQGWETHVHQLIANWKEAKKEEARRPLRWRCAMTTIPDRAQTRCRTLQSLCDAGFPQPDIYVDGRNQIAVRPTLCGDVSYRTRNVKTYTHWLLTLVEVYLKDPEADRYAIFQDDFVCCTNLRAYLDKCIYPTNGYWNLFTVMGNDLDTDKQTREKTPKAYAKEGWHLSNQLGQGGLALVFDNTSVIDLLTQRSMYERMWNHDRRHKYMDAAVVIGMNAAGRKEYIHYPSLVQHTGTQSTIWGEWKEGKDQSTSFRGPEWDALSLVDTPCET